MRTERSVDMCVSPLEARALLSTLVSEVEPNDRRGQAEVVVLDPLDLRAELVGVAEGRGDADVYVLRVPGTGRTRLRLARVEGEETDPIGVIVGTGGGAAARASGRADRAGMTIEAQAGQRLFVKIRSRGAGAADYHLGLEAIETGLRPTVRLRGGSVVEVEPNDTPDRANEIVLPAFGPLFVRGQGGEFDIDTFQFRATRGALLRIDNLNVAGAGRLLLDSDDLPLLVGVNPLDLELPEGGSVTVPVFRGLRYRLRWILDSVIRSPYVWRLELLAALPDETTGDPTTIGVGDFGA